MKVEPHDGISILEVQEQRQEHILSPSCEDTVRSWLSISQKEGPHQEKNLLAL